MAITTISAPRPAHIAMLISRFSASADAAANNEGSFSRHEWEKVSSAELGISAGGAGPIGRADERHPSGLLPFGGHDSSSLSHARRLRRPDRGRPWPPP